MPDIDALFKTVEQTEVGIEGLQVRFLPYNRLFFAIVLVLQAY